MKPLIVDEARFQKAVDAFDAYNAQDPNEEMVNGVSIPKELLYAQRMSKRLLEFLPDANESLQLAARSQHIGRWEIARSNFPMDKKGYFQWRNELKKHHASIAWRILNKCGYESESIEVALETPDTSGEAGIDLESSQRLKTVRALNADLHPSLQETGDGADPDADVPARDIETPQSIEDQINTSMTQTLKALDVKPPLSDSLDLDDDEEEDEKKGGFFSRFRRS